jgi:hypothetical protein
LWIVSSVIASCNVVGIFWVDMNGEQRPELTWPDIPSEAEYFLAAEHLNELPFYILTFEYT